MKMKMIKSTNKAKLRELRLSLMKKSLICTMTRNTSICDQSVLN